MSSCSLYLGDTGILLGKDSYMLESYIFYYFVKLFTVFEFLSYRLQMCPSETQGSSLEPEQHEGRCHRLSQEDAFDYS